jgi:hypothetical protein
MEEVRRALGSAARGARLACGRRNGIALAAVSALHVKGGRAMKTSTLLIMVTLSASCFAAPVHTALDNPAHSANVAAERANAAPVAPAAPGVGVTDDDRPQQWEHIALPKSHRLDRGLTGQNEHLQT